MDKVGNVLIMRNDKTFIIKVTKIKIVKGSKSLSLAHTKDYNEKVKNSIVMSIKQGVKLLVDNENSYQNIVDKLYYKFGRLMIAN